MSFVVGNYYKCIQATSSLTAGKVYECVRYDPPSKYAAMVGLTGGVTVVDDRLSTTTWDEARFDPNPVSTNTLPPAFRSIVGSISFDPPGKLPTNSVCSCGKQAEKKVFTTFEYFYCPSCKKEVGGKVVAAQPPAPKPSTQTATSAIDAFNAAMQSAIASQIYGTPTPTNTTQQHALPHGIAALKGEKITCATCGAEHGVLTDDLIEASIIRGSVPDPIQWTQYVGVATSCCPNENYSKWNHMWGTDLYYVAGRGWV